MNSPHISPAHGAGLHERLQALGGVGLSQRYRSVGLWTLQGSLVLLAAHQAHYGSVQILVLLLGSRQETITASEQKGQNPLSVFML